MHLGSSWRTVGRKKWHTMLIFSQLSPVSVFLRSQGLPYTLVLGWPRKQMPIIISYLKAQIILLFRVCDWHEVKPLFSYEHLWGYQANHLSWILPWKLDFKRWVLLSQAAQALASVTKLPFHQAPVQNKLGIRSSELGRLSLGRSSCRFWCKSLHLTVPQKGMAIPLSFHLLSTGR